MKNKNWLAKLSGGIALGAVLNGMLPANAEPAPDELRNDINPALRYYQGFIIRAPLDAEDHKYLIAKEWRGRDLDERAQELIASFNLPFKLYRRAAHATAPCDWGIDLNEGPETLLPYLAKGKQAAQIARLRASWHLQNNRPEAARDDLFAASVFAHNLSRDGTLISALVQIAMENILTSEVAGEYYRLSPEIFKQIVDGFDSGPKRGRIIDCLATEKGAMKGWFLARVERIRDENKSDPAKAMDLTRQVFQNAEGEDSDSNFAAVSKAAGGTVEGVVKLLEALNPYYDRLQKILVSPAAELESGMAALKSDIAKSENPLAPTFLNSFERCRQKEIANDVRLAMLRAAVAYRQGGEAAMRGVNDPAGADPFQLERFMFEGKDRGFKLLSSYKGRGYQEVMIFVEKPGPAFFLDSGNAGQPIPAK